VFQIERDRSPAKKGKRAMIKRGDTYEKVYINPSLLLDRS